MVLGKEGAGKTHLYHKVAGMEYERNISTDGIDVHTFELRGYQVAWFDCGGQTVFYPTHQFFITAQCVYLVVFALNDPDFLSRVRYWLQVIDTYASSHYTQSSSPSKVVIVGTHLDCIESAEADSARAQIEALVTSSVTSIVFVSCTHAAAPSRKAEKTSTRVKDAIMEAATQAGVLERVVPKAYTVLPGWFDDQRQRLGASRLAWEDVVRAFPGYQPLLLERALLFLHDVGVIFVELKFNLIILDVQWLCTCFARLLTFRHTWVKNGILLESDLRHVWKDFLHLVPGSDDGNGVAGVMSLFEKFQIAYPRRQEGERSAVRRYVHFDSWRL